MSEKTKGLLAINIAAVIFGSAALFGKLNVSPTWILAMRGLFASITLFIIGTARKEIHHPGKNILKLFFSGCILSIHWLTFFISVQVSGVAIATLTFASFPLFTLIIEAIISRKHLKPVALIASILIIVAVMLLVKINSSSPDLVIGAALGLISASLLSFFSIVSKPLTTRLTTITVSFYQNVTVFLVLTPFLAFSQPVPDEKIEWFFLLLLGIVTTALMHQLYFYALKRLTASTCSGFVALEPVYAILFAGLFFSEPVTLSVIVSGILIFIASFLILKS